ncbi:MAG: hypothetical protein EXS42_07725 [Lacunisphaera sp.]|nr:hypothetical protein [Lacunisphaera sp.]
MNNTMMRAAGITALVALMAATFAGGGAAAADAPSKSPLVRTRYLLLDSRVVGNTANATLSVNTVETHPGNPLFGDDKPWKQRYDNIYASVIHDETDRLYKLWYDPFIYDTSSKGMTHEQRRTTGYSIHRREDASSNAALRDGLKWKKPELSLVEYKGSKANNLASPSLARPEEHLPVGLQKRLLVDDHVIDIKQNITRALGTPVKVGMVMQGTLLTDGADLGYRTTVLWNEQRKKFQMIYRASGENTTGYAESVDGITWTKPLVAPGGQSNLITYNGSSHGKFFEAAFMIDLTLPWGHAEKFKAAFNSGTTRCAIGYSADGIHWNGYNNGSSVTGRAADTHNQILWDSIASRYLLVTRTDIGAGGGTGEFRATRIMAHTGGNNLLANPTAWQTLKTIRVEDPRDEKTPEGVAVLQMEAMTVWPYENVYFGLMHVLTVGKLTGSGGTVTDPDARHETDVIDFYIGTSRDGVNFDRSWIYDRKPFVQRGNDREFDKDIIQAATEILTRGDAHWIYYGGRYDQHHAPLSSGSGKIGLAKLPLDRFIGQQAVAGQVGTITTKPFVLEGNALRVNVDATGGSFRVEVLDEAGVPIPGFADAAANSHDNVNVLRLLPRWGANENLSALKGRAIRLKFHLDHATLYSFQIIEEAPVSLSGFNHDPATGGSPSALELLRPSINKSPERGRNFTPPATPPTIS